MTPTEIDTALTPFGQINGGLNKSHEGTGLGLPISVALMRLHRGTLEIESEKDVGTRVIVTLPPRIEKPAASAPMAPTQH
jgi:two-component system cell cycle sensor histidine kinase PleC